MEFNGHLLPNRTIITCPDPRCYWQTERQNPPAEVLASVAAEYGPFRAAEVVTRAMMDAVETECEAHFMDHMLGLAP